MDTANKRLRVLFIINAILSVIIIISFLTVMRYLFHNIHTISEFYAFQRLQLLVNVVILMTLVVILYVYAVIYRTIQGESLFKNKNKLAVVILFILFSSFYVSYYACKMNDLFKRWRKESEVEDDAFLQAYDDEERKDNALRIAIFTLGLYSHYFNIKNVIVPPRFAIPTPITMDDSS